MKVAGDGSIFSHQNLLQKRLFINFRPVTDRICDGVWFHSHRPPGLCTFRVFWLNHPCFLAFHRPPHHQLQRGFGSCPFALQLRCQQQWLQFQQHIPVYFLKTLLHVGQQQKVFPNILPTRCLPLFGRAQEVVCRMRRAGNVPPSFGGGQNSQPGLADKPCPGYPTSCTLPGETIHPLYGDSQTSSAH